MTSTWCKQCCELEDDVGSDVAFDMADNVDIDVAFDMTDDVVYDVDSMQLLVLWSKLPQKKQLGKIDFEGDS